MCVCVCVCSLYNYFFDHTTQAYHNGAHGGHVPSLPALNPETRAQLVSAHLRLGPVSNEVIALTNSKSLSCMYICMRRVNTTHTRTHTHTHTHTHISMFAESIIKSIIYICMYVLCLSVCMYVHRWTRS